MRLLATARALRLGGGRWSRCTAPSSCWQCRAQTTIPQHPKAARFVQDEVSLEGQKELGESHSTDYLRKGQEPANASYTGNVGNTVDQKSKGPAQHPEWAPKEVAFDNEEDEIAKSTGGNGIIELNSQKSVIADWELHNLDDWANITPSIVSHFGRRLYDMPDHPIGITCRLLESVFPGPEYHHYRKSNPVISTQLNFDNLGIAEDHPGRSRTDTYYVNKHHVLRTHTSGYQMENFAAQPAREAKQPRETGWTCIADVYRRDAIDRSHYPVFHQMEGARTWTWPSNPSERSKLATTVQADLAKLTRPNITVDDPNPTTHPARNPLQSDHTAEEVEAVAAHLKRSLEIMIAHIFSTAQKSMDTPATLSEPLPVRWIEAYFPFTSPSWEMEVFWQGSWLEVLGCGVVKQPLLAASGVPHRMGWAFGLGIERLAMLLFGIPDIRLFWSRDERFLSQFRGAKAGVRRFVPFSRFPECYKDVAFWLRNTSSGAGGGGTAFHENDLMEIVRDVAGDLVEDVREVDAFTHPKTGRKSLCYRINYRSLERTLTNEEANQLHQEVVGKLVERFGVEVR